MVLNLRKNLRIQRKNNKIIETFFLFIKNNSKKYIIVSIFFLIGIFLGVMFINNVEQGQKDEICAYVNSFFDSLKNYEINQFDSLKNNIIDNVILVFIIWFAGSTIVGIPIVFGIIIFRGFCIGYTIATFTYIYGTLNGTIIVLASMLLQNILFIPAIISMGVSSIKLYKAILKDKSRENIKVEIIRHTIFCLIILIVLLISAFIETKISSFLIKLCAKYLVK